MAKVTLQNFCFWSRKLQIHSSYPKTCHFRNVIPLVLSGANKFLSVIKSKQFRSRIFLPSMVEVQRVRSNQIWPYFAKMGFCFASQNVRHNPDLRNICSEQNGHLQKLIFFWESVLNSFDCIFLFCLYSQKFHPSTMCEIILAGWAERHEFTAI